MKYIKVYFDVISTSLRKDADLVSIGMIVNDPSIQCKSSLYIELTDYNRSKVTEWLDNKVIKNLLSDEDLDTLNLPWIFKCNQSKAEEYIFAWLNQIYDNIKIRDRELYKIQLVGDLCAHGFHALSDLLRYGICEIMTSDYLDLNERLQDIYNISAYQAFNRVRQVLIQEFEAHLDCHMIPTSFDEKDRERLIPQVIRDKANNALNKAFNISKLDAYLNDLESLHLFDE